MDRERKSERERVGKKEKTLEKGKNYQIINDLLNQIAGLVHATSRNIVKYTQ